MDTNEILDKAVRMCNAKNDTELAGRVGVSKQSVSNWRKAVRGIDVDQAEKLADVTGIPVNRIMGVINAAASSNADKARAWLKVANVAMVLCVVGFAGIAYFQGFSEAHFSAMFIMFVAVAVTALAGKLDRYAPNSHHNAHAA